ncbi:aspartate/glutamate racemase family protein [Sporosarcina siberiensis]|uniref:Aspartate/glutamate racemase family protein n=1 Tax=Sporosarcina siberiensis TaxID=1365606 RepID=A0ABW4SGZ7_9BACL
MNYQSRDTGIENIKAKKNHIAYGMGLGIMLLDEVYPGFPGDVRNASAYNFPIQYDIVEGIDIKKLVLDEDKSQCLQPILDAAKRLQRLGVKAIAAECGYFSYFQQEIASAMDIPVFMSSLLQVPMIQQVIGQKEQIGIVCAYKNSLTPAHLSNVGINPESNLAVVGVLDDYESTEFHSLWVDNKLPSIPNGNYSTAEADMIRICKEFVKNNPDIKALMFECTGFQPFARAVQRELGLPIFSWGTLLDYANSVTVHRDYYGHL